MSKISSGRPALVRHVRLGVLALGIMLTWLSSGFAQMTPEEHASHHPGVAKEAVKDAGGQEAKKGMAGMGDMGKEKGGAESKKGMGGGMGDMGKMMEGMGAPPPKELYPTLMTLPDLSPEKREAVGRQAGDRMAAGMARLSGAVDRLSEATLKDDYEAMQQATSQMREGLAQFESGLAARRALAEGKLPHQVAQQWFKGEMNLQPPQGVEARGGLFGITLFHLFTMVLLIAFALAMVAMYFFKMRRAAVLFGRIESDSGLPPPGSAPPLAETAPPPAADTKGTSA